MKIYISSAWNSPNQNEVVRRLKALGHEVYDVRNPEQETNSPFSLGMINPNWRNFNYVAFAAALKDPRYEKICAASFEALKKCDSCVVIPPFGRMEHFESFSVKHSGKKVYVYDPPSNPTVDIETALFDGVITSLEELEKQFEPQHEAAAV